MINALGLQKNALADDFDMGIDPNNVASQITDTLAQTTADAKAQILNVAEKAQEKIANVVNKTQEKAANASAPTDFANSVYNRPTPKLVGLACGAIAGFATFKLRAANAKYRYLTAFGVGVVADGVAHFTTAQIIQARGM